MPGKCLLATEPFGEQQVLSCEFSYADGAQPHSVWAVFDAAGTNPLRDERYAEACATRWPAEKRGKFVAEFLASPPAADVDHPRNGPCPGPVRGAGAVRDPGMDRVARGTARTERQDDEAYRGGVIMPLIERRTFAVPEPEDRPEGFSEACGVKKARQNRDLDAADPDDRGLITMHDASARGVPVQRFGSYVTVVEQLWANDPPEAWEAARRLQKARLSRGKIMDKLARAYDTSTPDAYPAALSRLRP